MQMADYTVFGAIIAVALGLVEVIKIGANRIIPAKSNGVSSKIDILLSKVNDISEAIEKISKESEELLKMHSVKDEDGVPLWYMRRSMGSTLKELNVAIGNLNNVILKMNDNQDRLYTKIHESHIELRKSLDKVTENVRDMQFGRSAAKIKS